MKMIVLLSALNFIFMSEVLASEPKSEELVSSTIPKTKKNNFTSKTYSKEELDEIAKQNAKHVQERLGTNKKKLQTKLR